MFAVRDEGPVFTRWFTAEIEVGEKYRFLASWVVVIFSLVYAVSFLGLMQYVAYLGPGLGDDLSFAPFLEVVGFFKSLGGGYLSLVFVAFSLLCVANVVFTAGIIMAGYFLYPRFQGKPFPVQTLFTYFSLNAVCTVGIWSIQLVVALACWLAGMDWFAALSGFADLLQSLRDWAESVPTLIDMPAFLAFFVLQMVGGFFHYWFHRLAHESRLLWLLFHRTHHMTPELIQPSTQAVFNAFPFFLFAAVPYVLIFSVVGKLITSESLLVYLIVYKLISAFANLWSHQTALYDWAHRKWYIRLLSTITSEGVYHYLHHSAESEHNADRGNLINIGGGLFFFWDRVFGTYRPVTEHKPKVGLQGIEPQMMTTNPLRLAFAGMAQMLYELINNSGLRAKFMILAGPSDFVPEKSKDYVLRED